jgi:hypothetical protein
MISDAQLPELSLFRRAEASAKFESDESYGGLVVARDNETAPIHRWFRFKESFSADLLRVVLDDLSIRRKRFDLLDPFCGVATSLLTSQEMRAKGYEINAVGIERNPFIAFAARAKVGWPQIDQGTFCALRDSLFSAGVAAGSGLPDNSSFKTSRCITPHVTKRLSAVAEAIRKSGTTATHDALLLGVASSIEPLSRTRKDGRALRIVSKPRQLVSKVLAERWDTILEDVSFMQRNLHDVPVPLVVQGDGRRPVEAGIEVRSVDIVFTSPPYPNNIDYTEVYKLELWLLGHVTTAAEFLALRRKTFRSHPTCGLDAPDPGFVKATRRGRLGTLLSPILGRISDLDEPWRVRVLLG